MKTEPTEALKYADKELSDIKIVYSGATKDSKIFKHKDLVCAFEQGQSSPKIKQLEWEKSPFFKGNYEANFGLGKYFIDDCEGCITLVCPDHSLKNKFSTVDEAKAAAQADFEKRIKECLE